MSSDKARDLLTGECRSEGLEHFGGPAVSEAAALRAMAAYGDLRARQERERCAKVLLTECHDDMTREEEASAIRSLNPETPNG